MNTLFAPLDFVKQKAKGMVSTRERAVGTAALVVGGAVGAYFLWPAAAVPAAAGAVMKAPGAAGFVISRAAFVANPQLFAGVWRYAGLSPELGHVRRFPVVFLFFVVLQWLETKAESTAGISMNKAAGAAGRLIADSLLLLFNHRGDGEAEREREAPGRRAHQEVETPQDAETSEDPEENTKEYYEALFASQKPLHENTEVTQLDAIARLMALKCHRNLCRDGFDELLVIVGSLLPKGHLLPQNFYYSTKLLSDLKMSSQQIHACPKGCMLFREEHADTNYCIKCNSSRYFEVDRNGDGQKRQTTVAKNILRYLPVLPRIQRLFMTEDTAQQMRWAVEGNRYTDKMIHPSDGTAWKNFVKKFPLKAGDPRSVAVAISTDGFNPYGMSAAVYSCWPVFVIPMNLPPGVCMRSENMFVSMIIPGPKYPGKNMNVYLEPLVDDLVRGWEGRGIRTYDASKKEYFDMYVWYHTSLHDLPARALFCGWCTHGKWPCPQCRQAVTFFWLNKGGKYSCFDEARQFLERRHAYRSDVKSFKKGRVVRGPKPIPKTGTEIKAELDALKPSPDGNGFLGYGETHQWTHKPCLWKLPYFEFLELPHNIDVMHTEKNISEAIWSTIVDTEKMKDNIKARIDQEMWCDRPELNMQPPHGAKKLGLSHTLRSVSQRPKKGRSSNG
ncbi:hypothetical protein QYE76_039847 [Lolium multiflorum]|uniref:Uncharacterized protein n=1 Tax=Lolium multiflorum TaxID=4521 RepID=A0AAD8TAG7_LOLMU|nr:hypothetical protein QYE76_039847 [Lolium multiflorum]